MKRTLEVSFSRLKHSIAAGVSRFAGCGKPDGSLSFPCRVTVLQGLVCRPFPASGRWHGCWSAARCVWMACVPKCRLIAVELLESELTRCQQALAFGAGGADFLGNPVVAGCAAVVSCQSCQRHGGRVPHWGVASVFRCRHHVAPDTVPPDWVAATRAACPCCRGCRHGWRSRDRLRWL